MKTYKIELTINLQGVSYETKQKALTYGRSLLFTTAYALEGLSDLRRYFFTDKQEIVLPPHSLMCECKRCSPSFNHYIKKLRSI